MESHARRNRFVALFMMFALMFSVMAPLSVSVDARTTVGGETASQRLAANANGSVSAAALQVDGSYCATLPTGGGVLPWLQAGLAASQNVDCFDVGVPVLGCGTLSIPFTNLTPFYSALFWAEGSATGGFTQMLPILQGTFPEDYNGGSVAVTVYIGTPEDDYFGFADANSQLYRFANGGETFIIDTDCIDPVPVDYCASLPAVSDVAAWLQQGLEAGQNVDCFDVGVPVLGCGTLSIPFTNLTPFASGLYWAEGTVPSDAAVALPIAAGTFAEDYNGGSVTVTVYIGTPEDDYFGFADANSQLYRYANGGETFIIDTDCIDPPTTTVLGCSQGFYKNNAAGFPALSTTLGTLGIAPQYKPATKLIDVISNPKKFDGYTRQQVTAYLNSLYVTGFELDQATILAGGYDQATLEFYNHGAAGDYIVADCPLD